MSVSTAALPPTVRDANDADYVLARRHLPILMLDRMEPFRPVAVGYHVFYESGPSPSFPRVVELGEPAPARCQAVIEYAFWWDWDIQHLYELEHAWVYVGESGRVEKVEASWHGEFRDMRLGREGGAALRGDRPVLYVKPGKHAFGAHPADFEPEREQVVAACGRLAGWHGVWETPLYAGRMPANTPLARRVVHTYLHERRFAPSFVFDVEDAGETWPMAPWPELGAWIPQRVEYLLQELKTTIEPRRRRWLRIAHRGSSEEHIENSAAAFRKARQREADMIEIDVRLTADGVAVVIHDDTLERTTTGSGRVREHTREALRPFRLRNQHTGEVSEDAVMTLDEVLALAREEMLGVYIDVKDADAVTAIADAIRAHGFQRYVIVGSGDREVLRRFREECPDVLTSWLVGWPAPPVAELLEALQEVSATYLHPCWENAADRPDQLLTREDVALVHAAGKGIITWHEERAEVIAGLRELGVDGVCSNRPEMLV